MVGARGGVILSIVSCPEASRYCLCRWMTPGCKGTAIWARGRALIDYKGRRREQSISHQPSAIIDIIDIIEFDNKVLDLCRIA